MRRKLIIPGIVIIILIIIALIIGINIKPRQIEEAKQNLNTYKFENDKLYITFNQEEWKEVPYDFSETIKYLQQEEMEKFKDNTYQINSEKVVFYRIIKINNAIYSTTGEIVSKIIPQADEYLYRLEVIYSNDQGETWNNVGIGNYEIEYPNAVDSIKFIDQNNGKIAIRKEEGIGSYEYITTDGGETWNEVPSDNEVQNNVLENEQENVPVQNNVLENDQENVLVQN